ncbi:DUF4421 domain-containing protein [Prevotella corporis]|uniref:DUF4421 domain-containing protein n=1 Tax=Prevotella corporis TaxID=28128 RepID=UPI0023F7E52F|nr:DUF4421 domain-containing protein [Prevotella corporis]
MTTADSIRWMRVDTTSRWYQRQLHKAKNTLYRFNDIDSNYIEPQHYNFTVMLQNTNTYEVYRLNNKEGQSITFAPEPNIRIGPYFGWRWIFLGYTIDIKHLNLKHQDHQRQEYDLSLYSSMVGIDFYYRKTGNDYKIRTLKLEENIDTRAVEGAQFAGLTSTIKGLNIYYIFNHRRFSYPAAFSQSTVQRRSAGSPLIGIGYTKHTLSVDWNALNQLISDRLGPNAEKAQLDSTMMFGKVQYSDFAVSGGYAYNWVFARNWLMAASLTMGLAYKRSTGDVERKHLSLREFSFKNLNIDGTGRFGIVWNDTKWYAGMSAILHAYNYRRSRFSTNNFFGSVNLYAGVNFGKKGMKKKKKKD